MRHKKTVLFFLLMLTVPAYGQAPNKPPAKEPDVLICKNGEKLIGKLDSATDSSIVFESDAAGKVTIDWSKVQELHSSAEFAVISKGTKFRHRQDANGVPRGTVSAADEQVQVSPAAPQAPQQQTVPVKNVANVVPQAAFERAFERHGLFQGWTGGATGGIAYTNATQSSQSYTAAVNLTRSIPGETWIDDRNRTLLSFTEAYGEISEPGVPTTKTSITHFGIEQDWYVNPRLFVFVHALLDHNYSQGLDLQQDYGGGIGFVVIKSARQEFDVKASVDYIAQHFTISSNNENLIGSTFGETYTYKFKHGILFNEGGQYIPAWNNTNAYSAVATAGLTLPVYHRIGFTFGGVDNYLNNPPLGFKKNSFTLTLGATYSIQ